MSISTHFLEWPLPAKHVVLFAAVLTLACLPVGHAHTFYRSVSLRRQAGKSCLDLAFEVPQGEFEVTLI